MTDTIDIRSVDALFDDAWEEVTKAQQERDEARAQVEQLRDLVSKQQREIRDLQDSRSVALKIIYDQQHELARLRRALSHS